MEINFLKKRAEEGEEVLEMRDFVNKIIKFLEGLWGKI